MIFFFLAREREHSTEIKSKRKREFRYFLATSTMGPRAAGFLAGSAASAVGCLVLLRYDVLHRHDAQCAHVAKLEEIVEKTLTGRQNSVR
jgi:hypothetical protein